MAGRLLFVILMYSFHMIQTQALPPPKLTVYPPVITETDSVTLNCQTPSSVSVSQCYFHIVREGPAKSFSCQQTLTGTDLLKITHQRSPAEVKLTCFYLSTSSSPESNTSSIIIQTLPPPTLTVYPPVITETDSVTLNCQTPSSVSVSQCYFYTVNGGNVGGFSCREQTLRGTELLLMTSQSSPAEVKVKCYYTVKIGDLNPPSPHSDTSSIIIHTGGKPQMSVQHFPGDHVLFTCSLPGSANHDTRCNLYFGETNDPVVTTTVWKQRSSTNQWFCQFTVTIDHLLNRIRLVKQRKASCDYSLGSEPKALSPHSDGYSLTDIVENESSAAPTRSVAPMSTDLTPGVSTFLTHVESASDIVEEESRMTQTMQTFTTPTTGLTVSRHHASTPAAAAKQTSDQTLDGPATKATVFPVTPLSKKSGTSILKLVLAATGFGVAVGVILLGLGLLCNKRRTDRFSLKRTQANIKDDYVYMRNLDHGSLLPAGNDATYSVATSVPGADRPAGSEKLNRQEPQNEDSAIYHVYSTISEEPPPSVLKDMVYSTLQAY
ncbi:uncharacterized protein LOC121613651 isoform X2 [Chelmon rostratus]|uniref:uncharacterized protein LOC121613651 isoform X2 n=1 Tax=Chelmon rostratus TaxID=109905 RepID=UPI001BEA70D8|nr:uncharacterized protein LOC121613651 isoform X2 [Chelmon rostratus]